MRIEDIGKENRHGRSRVAATVVWEDVDRPARRLFFETTAQFADDLSPNPNAFLLAAILPAIVHGEKRIHVSGRLCPELIDNLAVATGWLRAWYGPPRRSIAIEATGGIESLPHTSPPRAAAFLSGGVDSLAALRCNRLTFSPEHPRWIKDGLVLHGFDIGGHENGENEKPVFDRTLRLLSDVANEAHITLIPVHTNAKSLHDAGLRFNQEYHGAVLAATGHLFSKRVTSVSISSSLHYQDFIPWGSHPLLDPYYSSTDLRVLHDGFQYSRLEKVRIVGDWPVALTGLRVCIRNPLEMVNCGECHKCIRTMLELYVIDKLRDAATFPASDIDVKRVSLLRPGIFRFHTPYFVELYPHLRRMGRADIIRILERRRRQYRYLYTWADRVGLLNLLRECGTKYFGLKPAAMKEKRS